MMNSLKVFLFLFLLFVVFTSMAMAKITDGLVGYWPLDGNGDDKIGKSTGELAGGAKWTNAGRVNGAVELDGATGYVAVSGFTLTTTELTSVVWLKGKMQAAWAGLLCSRADPMSFWMGFTDLNTLSYVWNNNSDQTWGWKLGPVIPEDEWVMLAITIDPDQAVAYAYTDADGLESAENAIPHIEQTIADNLKIGNDECCGEVRHVMGIMDEVMIFDRPLSEAEFLQLATQGLAVDYRTDKLTTCWGEIKK